MSLYDFGFFFTVESRLPCQLAVDKVLFLEEAVIIHKNTTDATIRVHKNYKCIKHYRHIKYNRFLKHCNHKLSFSIVIYHFHLLMVCMFCV
jgi:hypothetical protein